MELGRIAVCGAINCNKLFEPRAGGTPSIYICPECEDKMNYGIKVQVHTHTGQTRGNFNLMEKIYGSLRVPRH
jgi:hypothetical protein